MKNNYHGWPLSAYVIDKNNYNKGVGQVTGGDQCYVFVTFNGNQERAYMPDKICAVSLTTLTKDNQNG